MSRLPRFQRVAKVASIRHVTERTTKSSGSFTGTGFYVPTKSSR